MNFSETKPFFVDTFGKKIPYGKSKKKMAKIVKLYLMSGSLYLVPICTLIDLIR